MKKATNSALMRKKNEKIILSLINKGPVSRADIAKKTGLTKAAVTIIVDDLQARNIVTEEQSRSGAVGRNPIMLHLNSDAVYFIGVNISRCSIAVGISDLSGRIVSEDTFPICHPSDALLGIKASIDAQISKLELDTAKIHKLAVVTPGPVDSEGGVILNPPNFKAWHNTRIADELGRLTGFPVMLENVSSATAIAEKYFGEALCTENFLALQIDEGIGSGIIINDALFRAPCEFGHISIKFDGIRCDCGNRGCLEKYASIPHILENTGYKTWQEAVDCDGGGIIEREAEYLSCAIISANNIFSFDKIVLCGDLTYKPEKIIDIISKKIESGTLSKGALQICSGKVKSRHLIAASVAIHDLFE